MRSRPTRRCRPPSARRRSRSPAGSATDTHGSTRWNEPMKSRRKARELADSRTAALAEILAALECARGLWDGLIAADPDSYEEYRKELALVLVEIGGLQHHAGRGDEADRAFDEAFRLAEGLRRGGWLGSEERWNAVANRILARVAISELSRHRPEKALAPSKRGSPSGMRSPPSSRATLTICPTSKRPNSSISATSASSSVRPAIRPKRCLRAGGPWRSRRTGSRRSPTTWIGCTPGASPWPPWPASSAKSVER